MMTLSGRSAPILSGPLLEVEKQLFSLVWTLAHDPL